MRQELPPTLPTEMVSRLIQWARLHPTIARIWAIGSRAKGTAAPDADLDLALEFDVSVDNELAELIDYRAAWKRELTNLLTVRVKDIQLANDPEDATYGAVPDHGVLLYEQT